MLRAVLCCCWLVGVSGGQQSNGRSLSCRDARDTISVRKHFWNADTSSEFAKLRDNGFTVSVWLRFQFNEQASYQTPFLFHTTADHTMMAPFGGDAGGWIFGNGATRVVAAVSDSSSWHQYAITLDYTNGQLQYFIDGQPYEHPHQTTYFGLPVYDLTSLELYVASAQARACCPPSCRCPPAVR